MNAEIIQQGWESGFIIHLFIRCAGLLAFLPFPDVLSFMSWRLFFACALSLLLLPLCPAPTENSLVSLPFEFFAGVICTLPLSLVVHGTAFFGELFDTCRGQNVQVLVDPVNGGQESAAAAFLKNFILMAALMAGGGEMILGFLVKSLTIFPPAVVPDPGSLGRGILSAVCLSAQAAAELFFPVASCFLAVELAGAFISRIVPNLSLTNEMFLMKTMVGGLILYSFFNFASYEGLSFAMKHLFVLSSGGLGG